MSGAQHTPGPWEAHKHSPGCWSVARQSTSGGIFTYLAPGMPMLSAEAAKRLARDVNAAIAKATGSAARNADDQPFIVTGDWLAQHATAHGGYTKQQLARLGVSWPPKNGWKESVAGKAISQADRVAFEAARGWERRAWWQQSWTGPSCRKT